MRQDLARVVSRVELAPGSYLLTLAAPWLAEARAGQFVHVRCGDSADPLLRRPLSICRVGRPGATRTEGELANGRPRAGEVSLLFRSVGKGTAWLATREPGDALDVIGPLGRPFSVNASSRNLLMVGGGVGVAPLVMLADEAVERGLAVTLAMGARTAGEVFPGAHLPPEVEYLVATEDGSLGYRGFVTEALDEVYDWADEVFACGPLGMLAAVKRLARRRPGTKVQVSLEEHMGCAVGVCFGCVVNTPRGPERVCNEGPVFDLGEVVLE